MPAPAFWKGYLKLSLVTCPVALTPATTEGEKVRFHTLNRKTGHRVRTRYVDSETGKPVPQEQEVKGYETSDGNFVTFDDEELESVALESVRTIDIDTFVPAGSIPWIWYDKPYFLAPNDKVGEEAFGVIRSAMEDKGVVGISRVVLFRRERAVLLEPRDKGIVLWTLRYGDEVRDADAYFEKAEDEKADPKLMQMVRKLIDERSKPWDASMVEDPVQKDLLALIRSRKKASKPKKKAAEKEEAPSNVVNLMDALKKSIEKSGRKSK